MDNQNSGVCILLYGCSACVCMCLHRYVHEFVATGLHTNYAERTPGASFRYEPVFAQTTRLITPNNKNGRNKRFSGIEFFKNPFDLIWYRLGSF